MKRSYVPGSTPEELYAMKQLQRKKAKWASKEFLE